MMLRHTWLITIAACLLIAGIVGGALYMASRPTELTIAVGPAGGDDAKLIQAIGSQMRRDRGNIRLRPILFDGPVDAARALEDGTADIAVTRGDRTIPKNGQAIAILRQNIVALLVPAPGSVAAGPAPKPAGKAKPAKIEKIENLAGSRIGILSHDNGPVDVLNVILKQYEIAPDKVTVVHLDANDVSASLKDKPVDAIFATGPVTAKFIADAIAAASTPKKAATFLPITASEAIENRLPAYSSVELKAGVFGGSTPEPEETVESIGYSFYVMVRKTMSETIAGDLTKQLFGVRQTLAGEFPAIAKIEKPDTDRDAVVPAHPGAAAFIDNDQKSFFDRYGDYMYLGVMVLSFFGSGFAWVASYGKADQRVRRMRVLEHLLDVIKHARVATSLDELQKLREDVDKVLHTTISEVEKNNLDEAALTAFSLALDQAQLAINDRRAELGGTAAPAAEPPASPESAAGVTQFRIATP